MQEAIKQSNEKHGTNQADSWEHWWGIVLAPSGEEHNLSAEEGGGGGVAEVGVDIEHGLYDPHAEFCDHDQDYPGMCAPIAGMWIPLYTFPCACKCVSIIILYSWTCRHTII